LQNSAEKAEAKLQMALKAAGSILVNTVLG